MPEQLCGKPVRHAKNGISRGTCTRLRGHGHGGGKCGNGTCWDCGILLTEQNAPPTVVLQGSGRCSSCSGSGAKVWRLANGIKPLVIKVFGKSHNFSKCGCTGVLPAHGENSKFAAWATIRHDCRVAVILRSSRQMAKKGGHVPMSQSTPHSIIRAMMEEPNCERCRLPLSWEEFGSGKTPNLHHDHTTGEIYGFTHNRCNPNALEIEIERLKNEIRELRAARIAA